MIVADFRQDGVVELWYACPNHLPRNIIGSRSFIGVHGGKLETGKGWDGVVVECWVGVLKCAKAEFSSSTSLMVKSASVLVCHLKLLERWVLICCLCSALASIFLSSTAVAVLYISLFPDLIAALWFLRRVLTWLFIQGFWLGKNMLTFIHCHIPRTKNWCRIAQCLYIWSDPDVQRHSIQYTGNSFVIKGACLQARRWWSWSPELGFFSEMCVQGWGAESGVLTGLSFCFRVVWLCMHV